MATRKRQTKKKAKGRDENELAASIVSLVTEVAEAKPEKNPAAVALGRQGGLKGGKARAEKLSPAKRSEIARKAAATRWKSKERRSQ
ncbi:MAG: hypothetical protein M5U32_00190 [Myxococcota bacterium]|nr:hypothetical protein [Myxococcota bacterium]